ncbi:MAG TPA: NAD(P)H-hydrate dehydratase, partial [Polyangiaceae bacterium]|nr:NAD(P)H-hydrate dehydratase [Polyangiaceae bacterium]
PQTLIVAPDGVAYRNTAGNVGLGTSGSGDALSGVIAGLSARGATALQAAVWGVYLHAKAGELLARRIGALGFLARELLPEIPRLLVKMSR